MAEPPHTPAQSAGESSKQFPSQSWPVAAYVQSANAPVLQAASSSHTVASTVVTVKA